MVRLLCLTIALLAPAALADEPPRADAIEFRVSHTLDREQARTRMQQLLEYWHRAFGVAAVWIGDHVHMTGRVHGIDIRGDFDVTDHQVVGFARDPGLFWRGQAYRYVEKKLEKYLDPVYAER